MDQVILLFTGAVAIWLSQDERQTRRKWASVFGLVGQPFWFYSSYMTEQWGIFILCFAYTYAWYKGFRVHWRKNNGQR